MRATLWYCTLSVFFVFFAAIPPHKWWEDALCAFNAASFGFCAGMSYAQRGVERG